MWPRPTCVTDRKASRKGASPGRVFGGGWDPGLSHPVPRGQSPGCPLVWLFGLCTVCEPWATEALSPGCGPEGLCSVERVPVTASQAGVLCAGDGAGWSAHREGEVPAGGSRSHLVASCAQCSRTSPRTLLVTQRTGDSMPCICVQPGEPSGLRAPEGLGPRRVSVASQLCLSLAVCCGQDPSALTICEYPELRCEGPLPLCLAPWEANAVFMKLISGQRLPQTTPRPFHPQTCPELLVRARHCAGLEMKGGHSRHCLVLSCPGRSGNAAMDALSPGLAGAQGCLAGRAGLPWRS